MGLVALSVMKAGIAISCFSFAFNLVRYYSTVLKINKLVVSLKLNILGKKSAKTVLANSEDEVSDKKILFYLL